MTIMKLLSISSFIDLPNQTFLFHEYYSHTVGTTEESNISSICDETLSLPNTPDVERDSGRKADTDHDSLRSRKSNSLSESHSSKDSSMSYLQVIIVNKSCMVACDCECKMLKYELSKYV